MNLREMIEKGATIVGNQTALAKVIGVHVNDMSAAKAGKRGLPVAACGKLAEILQVDPWRVVCASELVTEKNEEKRGYFAPFVLNGIYGLAAAATVLFATVPTEATAKPIDTFNVSAPAPQPLPGQKMPYELFTLCKQMVRRWVTQTAAAVRNTIAAGLRNSGSLGWSGSA